MRATFHDCNSLLLSFVLLAIRALRGRVDQYCLHCLQVLATLNSFPREIKALSQYEKVKDKSEDRGRPQVESCEQATCSYSGPNLKIYICKRNQYLVQAQRSDFENCALHSDG